MLCYLCGREIPDDAISKDHVVPRLLITRKQPKTKGYDFAGTLPSHGKCNNSFGPETYCRKAIALIRALYNNDCFLVTTNKYDPSIKIMALNSDCFPGFSERDLKYFKFIDVRNEDYSSWSNPSFFKGKPKTNAKKRALFIALSVLSKSAAALLISRKKIGLPSQWRIVAVPFIGGENLDFDAVFGSTSPFDVGIKAWVKPIDSGDWFVAYKAAGVLVYLVFMFANDEHSIDVLAPLLAGGERFRFEGSTLMELIDYDWRRL